MLKTLIILALLLVILVLWRPGFSFRNQAPSDYADTGPSFDIRTHLAGEMLSEGVIYGPTGRVASRFVAQMQGDWDGDQGTLREVFSYASGLEQTRQWTLTMGEGGRFTATAPDVIGVAQGEQVGAAVRMTYRIQLLEDAGGHVLDVTDWLYLMENGTVMNRSQMRKFGLLVGELIATIRPVAP